MERQRNVLSIFVASPSDVDEERNCLEEVIRDLNTAWSRELGIQLELIRWETHAYPSFGEDAQAVINEQILADYDLFIGIMWYKFGTPTGRAGSGTVEEFQRAKERFDRDPSSLQLMVYFKDAPAPIAPCKLDYNQIAKIAEFRSSLEKEGGLYWSFISVEDFERLVRLHLTRHIQSWRSKHLNAAQPAMTVELPTETNEDTDKKKINREDEPGLLDLMEQFEDEFETLAEISERIAAATAEVGEKMQTRTTEISQFTSGPDSKNRKVAKRLIAKAAADMDQYVQQMESELPLFSQRLNAGMNALIQATALAVELKTKGEDLEQAKENLEAVREFYDTLTTVEKQITDFQNAVASLPRMTTTLNRSKRAMVNILQQLIEELHGGQTMAREAEASLASMVKQK